MAIPIMIPSSEELGSEITLVRWLVEPGAEVESGQPLAEIEADKGVLEVEAAGPGAVLALVRSEGDTVSPGTVLGYLGQPGEAVPEAPARPAARRQASAAGQRPQGKAAVSGATAAPDEPAPTAVPRDRAASAVGQKDAGRTLAAPATRRLAEALGVDLSATPPTGAGGVVTRRDVEGAAAARDTAPDRSAVPSLSAAAWPPLFPRSQRVVAERVSRSHREIPPVHLRAAVDARRAVAQRAEGISYTAQLVHAAGRALVRFPRFRTVFREGRLQTAESAGVAFAVGMEAEGALYTPVLHGAEKMTLEATDVRVRELAAAAREHRLSAESLAGGCFLVTNLGPFGVDSFDPVIYPGHTAALAAGAVISLPAAVQGTEGWTVEVRPSLTLTLAVDHRLINGLEAAAFLSFVKQIVERGLEGGAA
jgi:pyruvate dehydrogenase E2 component (dihydrolipoamide acetyltransferase)